MSKARLVGAARDGPAGCAAWPSAGLPALRWQRAVAPSYGLARCRCRPSLSDPAVVMALALS